MLDVICWESKFKLCNYSERLLNKILLFNTISNEKVDVTEVKKAIYYAKKYHGEQKRGSGEPFYTHPLAVAGMVIDYQFKTDTIVTSILHDVIEDTNFTKENIELVFGSVIASQVEDLSKVKNSSKIKITSKEMVNALFKERKDSLLLIKYFDRMHNMQTIKAKNADKIKKITDETLEIFLDLGKYLKISTMLQNQLIDFCKSTKNIN